MADKDDDAADGPKWSELVKRVMSVGLGAAFMTEESVRSALSDLKLPKEVLTTLLQGANRSKEELMNKVGNETVKILSKIDFVKEASRFVEEHKFKITAEIDIVKKAPEDTGLNLKTDVKIKD
jgi:hypothetical protein